MYATQNANQTQIADPDNESQTIKVVGTYDVQDVYGGGNEAEYWPVKAEKYYADQTNHPYSEAEANHIHTNVIIDGCKLTSINRVFGGGNAASTPATRVTVNGTFEINEVFGGGNGEGGEPAHVGFHVYTD